MYRMYAHVHQARLNLGIRGGWRRSSAMTASGSNC